MVLYNTTVLEAANNPYTITTEVNNLSGGLLSVFFLAVLSLFLLILFRNTAPFKRVLLGVSFLVSLFSVLLWAIDWIGITILLFPLTLLLGAIIYNIWGG